MTEKYELKFNLKYHNQPHEIWGRFGGGWNWKLGLAFSEFGRPQWTLIIELLVLTIRINRQRKQTT